MASRRFIILKIMKSFFLYVLLFFFSFAGYCAEGVFRIDIKGNEIVSDATIISRIKLRAGGRYNENIINQDIKNLYATGFFETVEVEKEVTKEGVVITFRVREKPILKKIVIEGARFIRKKQILESIDIKEGSFIDEYTIKEATRKIKDLYDKKGFSQAEVSYELLPLKTGNEVEARLIISEKGIIKVRDVFVEGNYTISKTRILRLMKTKKAWLFNRGIFKEEVLRDDMRRVTDFYKLQGFGDIEVIIDVEHRPRGVYLTVKIDEGMRYYAGGIKIEGNKEIPLVAILEAMRLKEGDIFSEQAVYADSSLIRQVYVDRGYIFSRVEPLSFLNPETKKVDITYKIVENEIAYIDGIDIKGNIKTRDKIIRRELRINPGDRFDGKAVRRSKERLENLGFFEEIRFGTEPGSKANNVDLIVDVKEAKTGYFSFGGGYSTIDAFIGFVELRQRNFDYRNFSTFTGAGQDLTLMLSIGSLTDRYQVSFTNPWIFDIPVSFGLDGYKKGHRRDDDVGYAFEQGIKGGVVRLRSELSDYWKIGLAYRFEEVKITDIIAEATIELKAEEGVTDLSSGEFSLSFDTRDNVFSPSRGFVFQGTLNGFGGPFGGDRNFTKYFGRFSIYFPIGNESVIELKVRAGFAETFSDTEKIPIYERFFAGGASTVRGYRERKIGPIDTVTEDPIGGEAMFIGNLEYTYPLADFLKVATFFDAGEVWKRSNDFLSSSLKSSIGIGLRVKTPIGPVSIDYGWPLDKEPGEEEKEGRFHFNISRAF